MSIIKAVGIDLAKLVFSIHGVDEYGKPKLRKTIKRNKLLAEIAKYPPCIIGMEACSGAHYWAREFTELGHDVRIMASKFVIPYRQNEKTTPMMQKRYAKPLHGLKHALSVLKAKSNRQYCVCIVFAKGRLKIERRLLIGYEVCWLSSASSCPKAVTPRKKRYWAYSKMQTMACHSSPENYWMIYGTASKALIRKFLSMTESSINSPTK